MRNIHAQIPHLCFAFPIYHIGDDFMPNHKNTIQSYWWYILIDYCMKHYMNVNYTSLFLSFT